MSSTKMIIKQVAMPIVMDLKIMLLPKVMINPDLMFISLILVDIMLQILLYLTVITWVFHQLMLILMLSKILSTENLWWEVICILPLVLWMVFILTQALTQLQELYKLAEIPILPPVL